MVGGAIGVGGTVIRDAWLGVVRWLLRRRRAWDGAIRVVVGHGRLRGTGGEECTHTGPRGERSTEGRPVRYYEVYRLFTTACSMSKPPTDPRVRAAWLSAIAEPNRLLMLRALAAGEKSVSELARAANIEPVNASHHVLLMAAAGLVTGRKDGRFVRYKLLGATVTAERVELLHASGLVVALPLG
jgi:ArsR family transcriptional regulator, nickel/cobalt-responsive transcriptional repressor